MINIISILRCFSQSKLKKFGSKVQLWNVPHFHTHSGCICSIKHSCGFLIWKHDNSLQHYPANAKSIFTTYKRGQCVVIGKRWLITVWMWNAVFNFKNSKILFINYTPLTSAMMLLLALNWSVINESLHKPHHNVC